MPVLRREHIFLVTLVLLTLWTIVYTTAARNYLRTRFSKNVEQMVRAITVLGAGAGLLWLIVSSRTRRRQPLSIVLWFIALVGFGLGVSLPDHKGTSVFVARVFTVVAVAALSIRAKLKAQ